MKRSLVGLLLFVIVYQAATGQDSTKTVLKPLRFSLSQVYVPTALMLSGTLLTTTDPASPKMKLANWRNEQIPNFRTHIDDYLQFSPIVIAYGLDAFGVKSKTPIADRTIILVEGELLMNLGVQLLKNTTNNLRPDGTNYQSFPSGHTAQAFAAATFLSEEYKEELPWMPYFAYALASSVGVLRMANNKHYLSDVLFGAGFGILSMKIPYWTHHHKTRKAKQ